MQIYNDLEAPFKDFPLLNEPDGAEVVKKELMFEQLLCRLLRGVELMTTIVLLGRTVRK